MTCKATLIGLLLISSLSYAQYGKAPSGFYPNGFHGTIFTGKPTAVSGNEVTLTHTKGSKTENFVGVIETGCSVPRRDGSKLKMMAADLSRNSEVIAFYEPRTVKNGNEKHKVNIIFAIAFSEIGGEKVREEDRLIYYCTDGYIQFMAF